jgi:hypothetical protein
MNAVRRCNAQFFILSTAAVSLWAPLSEAHPVAQGAMDLTIAATQIRLQVRASMEEVLVQNTLSGGQSNGQSSLENLCRKHGDYLLQHLQVSADGDAVGGRLTNVRTPQPGEVQRVIYDLEYELPRAPARLRITQNVLNEFDYGPGNRWEATYIVRAQRNSQPLVNGALLTSRSPLAIDCQSVPAASLVSTRSSLTIEYMRHGIMHILSGWDHLLFISALVLAVVTLWDLIKVISAFTLAHSITLTLSVLNMVRLPGRVVEPMIAASIVFVALQNVFWPERSRGTSRLAIAFFFGLFHGLGFAGGLLDAMEGMAGLSVGLAIIAFSLGVEIGHQVVVLPLFGILKVLRAQRGVARDLAGQLFRYGSVAISIAGMFYLVAALRM